MEGEDLEVEGVGLLEEGDVGVVEGLPPSRPLLMSCMIFMEAL